MVYVVLTNGKVLQYNRGGVVQWKDTHLSVGVRSPVENNAIADIAKHLVSRVEFERPCQVFDDQPKRRKR